MIYGVAVLPEHRKLGVGSAIVRDLISAGYESGFDTIVLSPADDSLFQYYSSHTGFTDWFYVNEHKLTAISPSENNIGLTRISAVEYNLLRESLLAGVPHISFNDNALSYQDLLNDRSGGGLFKVATAKGIACAVVERQNESTVRIPELISSGCSDTDVLSAIATLFPADEYIFRTPSQGSENSLERRRFGMLSMPAGCKDALHIENIDPWFGLAFD
jgi:hypothetical protein